jgi:hypothetical protein
VIAMVLYAMRYGRAMVHCVGMGETMNRVLAVPGGEHRRGREEAKRRKRCEHEREPEAQPGAEGGQHEFRIGPSLP